MRERIAGIAAAGAAVVLFIVAAVFVAGRDSEGPIIMVPSGMSYKDGQDVNILLNGVTAVDDKDGDVSNTLVVESLIVIGEGDTAKVTYIARDSSNNVSYADAIISYSGDGNNIYSTFSGADRNQEEPLSGTETVKEDVTETTTEPTSEEKTSEEKTSEETTEEDATEEDTTEENTEDSNRESTDEEMTSEDAASKDEETSEEKTAEESAAVSGAPVLKLLDSETTINRGETFKVFKFVESITDDKDDRDYLYQRINIDGQYDIYTPGDYELYIFCVDSEAHQSNRERFVLHVAENGQ